MTLYLLAERIFRIYAGGDPSDETALSMADIKHMIKDEINKVLKVETISLNRQLGEETPSNLMVATYTGVTVSTYGGVQSRAELPAVPVSLPKNMGVWWVSPDASDATRHNQFVPMQLGQWALIKDMYPLVTSGKILNNYTYEVEGKYLVFPTDITGSITTLLVKLVISDPLTLGDYDLLPIPADYVSDVFDGVLRRLGVTPPEDSTNDGNSQRQ